MNYVTMKSFVKENNLSRERLTQLEIEELYRLVQEIHQRKFQYSSELSQYIANNKLGFKYPNISGIVKMKSQGTSWKFKGGFPPNIYRLVCKILNLSSYGTRARATGFKSYASLGY
jgi:hypothetical protein